jgi:endonuclease/exonuclease/phosphatase family metal-dependent hydrolase
MMKKMLIIANLILSLGLMMAYAAAWIPPDVLWWVAFAGTGTAYLMVAHLILVVIWLFLKPAYAALNVLILCAGFSALADTVQWNYPEKSDQKGIRIVTCNVGVFSYKTELARSLLTKLSALEPDILCIQEIFDMGSFNTIEFIKQRTGMKYHAFYPVSEYYGLITFSRYPITQSKTLNFNIKGLGSNGCLFTDIKIKNQKIRVYNTHLTSMRIQSHLKEIYEAGTAGKPVEQDNIFTLLRKMRSSWKKQVPMAEIIRAHMDSCTLPIVLCGDMNATPYGYIIRKLGSGLQDTYRSRGKGFGFTFRSNFPLLRIDYIFVPETATVRSHAVPYMLESDHFPVVSEVRF